LLLSLIGDGGGSCDDDAVICVSLISFVFDNESLVCDCELLMKLISSSLKYCGLLIKLISSSPLSEKEFSG
jgi:hypothetical protein